MYEGLRRISSVDSRKECFLNCRLWVKKKILSKYWEQFLPISKTNDHFIKSLFEEYNIEFRFRQRNIFDPNYFNRYNTNLNDECDFIG